MVEPINLTLDFSIPTVYKVVSLNPFQVQNCFDGGHISDGNYLIGKHFNINKREFMRFEHIHYLFGSVSIPPSFPTINCSLGDYLLETYEEELCIDLTGFLLQTKEYFNTVDLIYDISQHVNEIPEKIINYILKNGKTISNESKQDMAMRARD